MADKKRIYLCLAHNNFGSRLMVQDSSFRVSRFKFQDSGFRIQVSGFRIQVSGVEVPVYDSNYWLCTITIDENVKIKGQENAYKTIVTGAVGGAAGVIHAASSAVTDCQPDDIVEALRVYMDVAGIEARPVWKPMHKQPVYRNCPAYVNGVSEAIFKVGMCLPAGPYVSDEDVKYIVNCIKGAIV